MVDAAGAQPSLSDLEPPPFAQQDILCGHANVVEFDLGVAVRRVVETHDRKVSQHPDTRRLRWHQDHRLLTIGVGPAGVCLAHDDQKFTRPSACAGDVPFAPVYDVIPAFPLDIRADVRSEEHTSELQSLMRCSYAVFCLIKKKQTYAIS